MKFIEKLLKSPKTPKQNEAVYGMRFIEKMEQLRQSYRAEDTQLRGTVYLYGVNTFDPKPPLAEHLVFSPMPKRVMEDLVNDYVYPFPEQLLTLYRYMNGAIMFWKVLYLGKDRTRIPNNSFAIYGLPDPHDPRQLEPFSIKIEDFRNRPGDAPRHMLKFGGFYRQGDLSRTLYYLFVDTQTQAVHSIEHGSKKWEIIDTWDSIDDCLCEVFDLLSASYLKE
jgi:hypothetical protein